MKLKNLNMAGKPLITSFGTIQFDENGIAEVEDMAGEKLATLAGYTAIDDAGNEISQEEIPENESPAEPDGEEPEVEPSEDDTDGEEESVYTDEELEAMNVPQLRKIVKDMGLEAGNTAKKSELIEMILNK